MSLSAIFILVVLLGTSSFFLGRGRAVAAGRLRPGSLHSLPGYYGWYAALWAGLPGLTVVVLVVAV
jgi:phosphate transport system permease protein